MILNALIVVFAKLVLNINTNYTVSQFFLLFSFDLEQYSVEVGVFEHTNT